MTLPRSRLICAEDTPYYHIVSRCVRRAFLCGFDGYSNTNYEHRRQWVEDKLFELEAIFAMDVAAYAVMSNHYHLVLYIDSEQARGWSDVEVLERWCQLFSGPAIVAQYLAGVALSEPQLALIEELVATYRTRLSSISWFMRLLNQSLAHRANREDNCTGKFFEGRFKSQALLDEAALLSCMAYVDLNPVRAKMADTPETSEYTSIQRRISAIVKGQPCQALLPFVPDSQHEVKGIVYALKDYIELVDWTGRVIREDKRGAIPSACLPILERLNLSEKDWLLQSLYFEKRFKRAAGQWQQLQKFAQKVGQQWLQGKAPTAYST